MSRRFAPRSVEFGGDTGQRVRTREGESERKTEKRENVP